MDHNLGQARCRYEARLDEGRESVVDDMKLMAFPIGIGIVIGIVVGAVIGGSSAIGIGIVTGMLVGAAIGATLRASSKQQD